METRARRANTGRRPLAAVASVWLVACVVLGARHEATVAHVHDSATGALEHAERLIGNHTGHQSDFHAVSPSDRAGDACEICLALHQASRPAALYLATFIPTAAAPARSRVAAPLIYAHLRAYRLAPKTSPPSVA